MGGLSRLVFGLQGNSSIAYLVMQNGNLEYGEPRCGFNTKHRSTKAAPREQKMLKGHLPIVMYHRAYLSIKRQHHAPLSSESGTWQNFGLGFQVKVLSTFQVVPSSLGSGRDREYKRLV